MPKRHVVIAVALAGLGAIGLVATFASHRSVREDIDRTYRQVGTRPPPEGSDGKATLVYASGKSVRATAADITAEHKPADRRTTEAGAFLRYKEDVVSVVPPPAGTRGSQVLVDDEQGGYRNNYFFVGGFWGTYSGPAGSFRGGGPGVGK